MLTKEDKTSGKNVWESKKYGMIRLIKDFQTRNEARVVWRTFWSDCERRCPLNEHPIVDVCARGDRSVGLSRCWRRTFSALLTIATLKITTSKWQHYKF